MMGSHVEVPNSENTLYLRRRFDAPRDRVYAAWTQAEALAQWFVPCSTEVEVEELDVRVGGRYRIRMRDENGTHVATGIYREVRAQERLVFTWEWAEGGMDIGQTLVTLEFRARGAATELVFIHERFPTTAARDEHEQGWTECLDALAEYLQAR